MIVEILLLLLGITLFIVYEEMYDAEIKKIKEKYKK